MRNLVCIYKSFLKKYKRIFKAPKNLQRKNIHIVKSTKDINHLPHNTQWTPNRLKTKDLGLCGSLMRSNVRIPLNANNSLGPARQQSRSITRFVWRRSSTWVRGLPVRGRYTKYALEGFLFIKKKKKKKKERKKVD
jgi:hypothetical protein